jgi:serine/threonine protein kinase
MHRDIKSKNILVNDHGNYIDAKVSSFMILDQVAKEGKDISMIMKTYIPLKEGQYQIQNSN